MITRRASRTGATASLLTPYGVKKSNEQIPTTTGHLSLKVTCQKEPKPHNSMRSDQMTNTSPARYDKDVGDNENLPHSRATEYALPSTFQSPSAELQYLHPHVGLNMPPPADGCRVWAPPGEASCVAPCSGVMPDGRASVVCDYWS